MIPTVSVLQDLLLDGIAAFAFLHVSVSLICISTISIRGERGLKKQM
jgi:hypothetical protein